MRLFKTRMNNKYYTYAYLREDRTPYYIGKGEGFRAYKNQHNVPVPKDRNRIIFLKKNLTEEEAFKHETYLIAVLGRKDLGTGILRNLTDGGEGVSGVAWTEERRRSFSEYKKKNPSIMHKESIERHRERMKNFRHTEESKIKISKSNIGRKWSEESLENISKIRKGIPPKINQIKWKCLVTGHISTAGPLTGYQKARRIDTSMRVRLDEFCEVT